MQTLIALPTFKIFLPTHSHVTYQEAVISYTPNSKKKIKQKLSESLCMEFSCNLRIVKNTK